MIRISSLLLLLLLVACAAPLPPPPAPFVENPNFDGDTERLVRDAERVVFLIPFSHWDTDWHETYDEYSALADQNILDAIAYAKQSPRFRYALEQVLFVQHFWETHPDARNDLARFIKNRQFSFAWGGITQPETSLVDPAIQERNLELGRAWIAETFGPEFVPHTAWQSDAFGNSAAFPMWLRQHDIPYLFIGRPQGRCDTTIESCPTLPHAFYWKSPAAAERVLVAYFAYPSAWDATHRLATEREQLAAFRTVLDQEFARTAGKYLFIPLGSDFQLALPNLESLVAQWNAEDQQTALVVSDPEAAFRFLEAQALPEITVDMNPIWQAFYVSRPSAKIADKESAFYLTAAETFGVTSSAWYTASINAHYDNIGGVSFDRVWESTQRPRFQQTLDVAAADLTAALAEKVRASDAPFLAFNPSAWRRSGAIEVSREVVPTGAFAQELDAQTSAVYVANASEEGYASEAATATVPNLVSVTRAGEQITLSNGLILLTLDAAHGGTFTSLKRPNGAEIISGYADDVVYWQDDGDVYGARFGSERDRSSTRPAAFEILAQGPLLARVQLTFLLAGVPVTKTVTLRANEPQVDVAIQVQATPQTTVLVQTPTTIQTVNRTDDLGALAYTHRIDTRPITAGDITYRRKIFYPILYWTDVRADGKGLTLLTHGLQGIAGAQTLSWMLTRDVSDGGQEGVTDRDVHTLRYAYRVHNGGATNEELSLAAMEFNQPFIVAKRSENQIEIALPFREMPTMLPE